jgi:hypothetical protein
MRVRRVRRGRDRMVVDTLGVYCIWG